jgi:hypothetical protein
MRAGLAALLALAAACAPDGGRREGALEPGKPAPQEWTTRTAELDLAWVVHESDLLSCTTAAHDLRQVLGHYGGRVRVHILAVGGEQQLIRSFLRSERLDHVPVLHFSDREFRSTYGANPIPAIFLVRHDTIVDRVEASRAALLAGGGTGRLGEAVARQMSHAPVPAARAVSHPPRSGG